VYEYEALITRVIDGDTMDFEIDLGFGIKYNSRLRLYGVDTPEVRGDERSKGLAVKEAVRILIENKKVILKTHKWKGKYGRYVAKIIVAKGMLNMDLSEYLVSMGMAKRVNYD